MRYTQVPLSTFDNMQINAGIICADFNPTMGSYKREDIIGATTGGNNFVSNPQFVDFGEDVDNVPPNTYQLKRITSYNPVLSGTFVTATKSLAERLIGAAKSEYMGTGMQDTDTVKITPLTALKDTFFKSIWLVGDYSAENGEKGGFCAIHIKNSLSTGGFQWQTTKDGKGQFAYEFTGHYDIENVDDAPFELYIKEGESETSGGSGG